MDGSTNLSSATSVDLGIRHFHLPRTSIFIAGLLAMLMLNISAAAQDQADEPPPVAAPDADSSEPSPPLDGTDVPPSSGADELASEESLARFQQLLQRRPFHGPAFNGLVSHYAEQNKLPALVKEYETRVESLPNEVPARIVLARLYLRTGNAQKAADIADALDQLPAEHARLASELLVFKSEVYQRIGRTEAAEQMLVQAMDRATSVSETLKLAESLADLHLRSNQPDKAAAALLKIAEQYPDQYLHQKRIADALAQRNLHDKAAERYQAALALVQHQPDKKCETLRQLGISLERLGKRDEAIAAYTEAVGLLASDHWLQRELHDRIVALYRASNRLDDLSAYCQAQIARAPEQIPIRILLANVQALTGQKEAARQTMADAVGLFPRDLSLSEGRIQLLEHLGDSEGVGAEYQRIITLFPDDAELYIAYGQFLANHKQIEAARNQWRHVLNTRLNAPTLANRLGGMFESYDLFDDAAETYERGIALAPDQPEGYTALSRLWLIRGDREKAAAALERAARANPDNGPVQAALAQAMFNLGMDDKALDTITRACELMPDQVRYRLMRSDLLVRAGRLEEALEVRRDVIDVMTNPLQQIDAINVLVSMHASANRLPALKEREQQRLTEDGRSTVSLLLLARAADLERDFHATRQWLEKLLAVQPGHEPALQQLARLHDAVGDVDASVGTWQKLIDLYPTRGRQYYEAIVDLKLRYGDKAGAVDVLDRMVHSNPGNAAVLSGVAEQLVRMGDPERAVGYYEKALAIQPDRHETRLAYGKALADSGGLDEALDAFRVTAMQRADAENAAEALGRMHDVATQLGTLEELIDELQTHVQTDPENTLVARALAQLLVREFEYNRAMELLDLVMRHKPRDVEIALSRADLLRRLARFDDAIDAYQQVLRFANIDRDYVLGELGKAHFESGNTEQAAKHWKQIQNKLYAGSLLKNNGLLDQAIAILEEGIRQKPDDYALHRNLVEALQSAGRTDDALSAARRLLDLEPTNIYNVQQLASAYLKKGNRAAAADIASRLFGSAMTVDKSTASGTGSSYGSGNLATAMMYSQYAQYGYSYGGRAAKNLDRAIQFFRENGLVAELEEVLQQQIAAQSDNSVLKQTAADLFGGEFSKPELALQLYRELETASFPLNHQPWLGQCSQRDFLRVRQYNLIASKPSLRTARLADLEQKKSEDLARDELLELAAIRIAQGANDQAVTLLRRAIDEHADQQHADDTLAMGILVDLLVGAERFADAEPYATKLASALEQRRQALRGEMIERVRRDFVRVLPLELQLRVDEHMLGAIADKWTLGQGLANWTVGSVQTMGYLRAQLALATIKAKTNQIQDARAIWTSVAPADAPDVDNLTMLGSVAQLHEQQELAFEFYQRALSSAKTLAGDPLLQQVYGTSMAQTWYGESRTIDTTFNKIVEAFSQRNNLVELYDFLRETDQISKARRIAEQYKLDARLKEIYQASVDEAREAFRHAPPHDLNASVAYFAQVCKLSEVHDRSGDWPAAKTLYGEYLTDFPNELGLLMTLREVAEARNEIDEAIEWERKVLAAKLNLAKMARQWGMRDLALTPARPAILEGLQRDSWEWNQRWGGRGWGWGGWIQQQLERSSSWLRLAELYLAKDNPIAAGDAMQRAVADAGNDRRQITNRALDLIQRRQLTGQMLGVLRALAVYVPNDERVQLAFADALIANDRRDVAAEVCNRMIRRGVSDLGVLAQVRQKLQSLNPDQSIAEADLTSLEAEVAADPSNFKNRLRLAKAYYFMLEVDRALETALALAQEAPHLDDLHDLLVQIYTLTGDGDKLVQALQTQIDRASDEQQRMRARWRLLDELLAKGDNDAALKLLNDLGDPRDPTSYQRVAALLHYFGKHEQAIQQLETAAKNKGRQQYYPMYGSNDASVAVARGHILKGDLANAAEHMLKAIDETSRQQTQYMGVSGIYNAQQNQFEPFATLFVLYPQLAADIQQRIEGRLVEKPNDPETTKLLMQVHRTLGRADRADALLDQMLEKGQTDQSAVAMLIDRLMREKNYDRAVSLAENFIAQQPKPQLPPGVPPQYAAMMIMQSPRNFMLLRLGDIYWEMAENAKLQSDAGDTDENVIALKGKAFECYKKTIDEKIDETRMNYASICASRGRIDEARQLVEESLAKQEIKSPDMLQFQALLSALDNDPQATFNWLTKAAGMSNDDEEDPYQYMYEGESSPLGLLGTLAQQYGLMDRYAQVMQERIAAKPHDWVNYDSLAEALASTGRIDEAVAVLDVAAQNAALALQADQKRLELQDGFAAPATLVPLYEKLIDLTERKASGAGANNPMMYAGGSGSNVASVWRNRLGDLLWELGEQERAEKAWAERLNLQQAASHLSLGQRFMSKQAYDKAERAFAKALELDPDNTQAQTALADLAFHRQDRQAALDYMRTAFVRSREGAVASRNDPYQYQYGYDYSAPQPSNQDQGQLTKAMFLSRDASLASRLSGTEPEPMQARMMLASLTGNWNDLEAELDKALKDSPYDPMLWNLWAAVQQRRGDWERAATAWEFLRRAKLTNIAERREQLKLVLAGKQIKEAAAGARQANNPAAAAAAAMASRSSMMYPSMYYGRGWWSGNPEVARLAGLYLKNGQFEKAERLFLLSSNAGGGVQASLPALASLMWEQARSAASTTQPGQPAGGKSAAGLRDRALEMMRLSLMLSGADQSLPQYASMLAESGQVEDAADLLIRAYRWLGNDTEQSMYSAMYGSYGDETALENYQEQPYSRALFDILNKSGTFDATLSRLQQQAADQPNDSRLGKLVLSLQISAGRWDDAEKSLAQWRAARPHDSAVLSEHLHAQMQLGRWDEALQTLGQLRQQAPNSRSRWILHESFIHLMKNDAPSAAMAVKPLLEDPAAVDMHAGGVDPQTVYTVLAAARQYATLTTFLEHLRQRNTSDSRIAIWLHRLYCVQGRWQDALRLALSEYWKQPTALDETSAWHSAVAATVRGALAAAPQRKIDLASLSAEDQAVVALIADGPGPASKLFAAIVASRPDSVSALRGWVLAATLADDATQARQANEKLLAALEPLRRMPWQPPAPPPLKDVAESMIKQMSRSGTASIASSGSRSHLQQALQQIQAAGMGLTHNELWREHVLLHSTLLARQGDLPALTFVLKEQALAGAVPQFDGSSGISVSYTGAGWATTTYSSSHSSGARYPDNAGIDWQTGLRQLLWQTGRVDELLSECNRLGSRVPETEWPCLAECFAIAGQTGDAEQWRRDSAELLLMRLRATDEPTIEGEAQVSRWYWYTSDSMQRLNTIRSALLIQVDDDPESDDVLDESEEEEFDWDWQAAPGQAMTVVDEVWEYATIDPSIEQQFLAHVERLGPGWSQSQTLQQAINYLRAKKQPQQIVALLERVRGQQQLLHSRHLGEYVRSCFKTAEYGKLDHLLHMAVEYSSMLENDVSIVRLMALRRQPNQAQADALEAQLIAAVPVEVPNPCRIEDRLVDRSPPRDTSGMQQRMQQQYMRSMRMGGMAYSNQYWRMTSSTRESDLPTANSLAQAMGVRFDARVRQEDVTIAEIRSAYHRHGLHDHAARLINLELQKAEESDTTDREKLALVQQQAGSLWKAGQQEQARKAAREAERLLQQALAANPGDASLQWELAALCQSDAFGPDLKRAAAAVIAAREIEPLFDPARLHLARIHAKLGQYQEAWAIYNQAMQRGRNEVFEQPTIYEAGFVASKAGDAGAAQRLLRQAQWRFPTHTLAAKARESIHAQ
jgi:tetratricopeptide (TPR) repeat protein